MCVYVGSGVRVRNGRLALGRGRWGTCVYASYGFTLLRLSAEPAHSTEALKGSSRCVCQARRDTARCVQSICGDQGTQRQADAGHVAGGGN